MTLENRISTILKAADDKKAFDIKVLNISDITSITDYFIILSGNSSRQVVSIGDEIEDKLKLEGLEPLNKDGYKEGRWLLLDYGDIIVHVFHKEERDFYNLERLWVDGKNIPIDGII